MIPIPSQTGRRALITGANSGIGYWTALELARAGATVVLAVRDTAKGEAAAARIRAEVPAGAVEVLPLDLASLASVHAAAQAELDGDLPLDLLIHNAGVMAPRTRQVTRDGFELQFGTNVLGHFALTGLLLPALERAAVASPLSPRVVTVASIAHKSGKLHLDDLQFERSYSPMTAYQQSKLGDLVFALELARRLERAAPPLPCIVSVGAHPGVANTNLFQVEGSSIPRFARAPLGRIIASFFNPDEDGAVPTLYAAVSPDAVPGGYYGPQGWMEMRGGDAGPAQIAAQARDTAAAARLWEVCEELSGVRFL